MKQVIIGLFFIHFTLITICVLENVKIISPNLTYGIARTYSVPFFEQNWGMFSNPPTHTRKVFFQYHEVPFGRRDTLVSEWYDVNQAMYDFNDAHLFSIAQRLIKYESGCLNNIFEKVEACQDSTLDRCIQYSAGYLALRNYAKLVYHYNLAHEARPVKHLSFQLKIVEERYPTFENRHLDFFDKDNYVYAILTTKPYTLHIDSI